MVVSLLVAPVESAATPAGPSSADPIQTSFETPDGLAAGFPVAKDGAGRPLVSGVVHGAGNDEQPGLAVTVDDGPDRTYAAKADVGYTGLHALHYSGRHAADGPGHAETVVMDDRSIGHGMTIGQDTELSYLVFPDFDENERDYAGTFVAIDLAFTDGTRLSQLRAVDQKGVRVTARAQGSARTLLYPLQWNRIATRIGDIAQGKVVEQVVLVYDNPDGPADIAGWLDDVRLGATPPVEHQRPSDWVLTTRGTQSSGGSYSRGNNFPATAVPNGFNFWTAQTDASSLSEFYAWNSDNNADNVPEIQAFAASHQPSIWMGDRQTFQFMPSTADGVPDPDRAARALAFRHDNETASPHHYGVTFDNGLRTDLAPTDHAALVRIQFPQAAGRHILFDNVDDRADITIDASAGTVTGWSDTRIISTGMGRMFLYAIFDAPITGSGKLTTTGRPSTGYVSFDRDVIQMRVATSLISVDQARRNLEQEIAPQDTLAQVTERAQQAWDDRLGVVEVEGGSPDQLTTLYSNLYRVNLYPNSAYENVGSVSAPKYRHAVQSSGAWGPPTSTPTETGSPIADGKVFVNTGFWDTFRAAWPTYSLLTPDVAGELVDGFVQQYRDGGWISPWSSPGYSRVMTGTSSDSAFADAFVKGVPGIDADDTYDAALKNATVRPPDSSIGRDGLDRSPFTGYVSNATSSGFAWSIDGAMNDFSVSRMAEVMSQDEHRSAAERGRLADEAAYLRSRSLTYKDLFDPAVDFFQGRDAAGTPTTSAATYDPEVWGNSHDYTEADGWNVAFPAPYDGEGLAELYGGRKALADKLDAFFSTPETASKPGSYGGPIHEMRETRDLRLGQWSIPNQVSHHIPWMYAFTQEPWKGQQQVRLALDRGWLGSEIGQGYPGDEDNGATSAWWVFGALGLYPLQMASGQYVIGSPLFDKATLHLPGGDVVIEAPAASDADIYVQSLTVDGQAHSATTIDHDELADGATLRFTMGSRPSAWGTGEDDVPVSATTPGETAQAMTDVTGTGRGTVTASVGTKVAALSDDTSTTAATLTGASPSVVWTVSGGREAQVSYYTITSGDTAAVQDPRKWVLEGSFDGRTWHVLDRRDGEQFRWRGETRPFSVERPGSYDHYRLRFLGGRAASTLSVAEIELLTADQRPQPPLALRVDVDDATVRPGGSGKIEVTVRNTSTTTAKPTLRTEAPTGWRISPENPTVPSLAPGATTTITATVTPPAAVAPGQFDVSVTAGWNGWDISASGRVTVVGDVTEMRPGTTAEHSWLIEDTGSSLGTDGDNKVRYADQKASFTYRAPLPADVTGATVTLDIANQFLVEASSDGTHWTTVLREQGTPIFQSNREQRSFDLGAVRAATGNGSGLYLRISDSHPEDGWGGWLALVRLETTS